MLQTSTRTAGCFAAALGLFLGLMSFDGGISLAQGADDIDEEARRELIVPRQLVDIEGNLIDVAELAQKHHLVVVTVSRVDCAVCRKQLSRIEDLLPELEACNVRFLVLAPGDASMVSEVRKRTGFPYPFIADGEMAIAQYLNLILNPGEIFPCMFEVLPDLTIGWQQRGRNRLQYGDDELMERFACDPTASEG